LFFSQENELRKALIPFIGVTPIHHDAAGLLQVEELWVSLPA